MRFVAVLTLLVAACSAPTPTAPPDESPGGDTPSDSAPPPPSDEDPTDSDPPGAPRLAVDPAQVFGELPAIGYNMTYINRGQGLVASDGSTNLALREALVSVGTDWLRYPGGTYANLFDWRTAIGPVESRWTFNAFTGQPEQNVFGLDEAGRLAEDMGGKLLCVININLGLAAAANWVEYMNAPVGTNPNGGTAWANVRAANGHPEPYGIHHWELANEWGNGRIWQIWDADDDFLSPNAALITADRRMVVVGGSRSFTNYQAVTPTTWAYNDDALRTTSAPNQRRFIKLPTVERASVTVRLGETPDSTTTWTMVDDLASSGPLDNHYELNAATGEIRFGDGVNGAIPPAGVFVFTDFRVVDFPGLRQYAEAMKLVDPSIAISGSFGYIDQAYTLDPTLPLDGWQWHIVDNYPVPDFYPEAPFANMMSRVSVLITRLDATAKAYDTPLRIYGTEVHPWQDTMDGGLPNLRNTALGAVGLVTSYVLASFIDDKVAVLGPNYLTWQNVGGQSSVNPATAIPTAEAWGLKLLRDYTAARRVAVDVSPPAANRRYDYFLDEAGTMSATADVPELIVLASTNAQTTELDLLVINTTPETTLTREISVAAPFSIDGLVAVERLASTSPTDANNPTTPRAVAIEAITVTPSADGLAIDFPPTSITGVRFSR